VVQAVGAAFVVPTSLSLLLAAYPPERRSLAVGAWASIGAAAAALGPPVGGFLVQLSWQWVFLVNVPVGVLAFVVGLRVLSESRGARVGMPDLLGAAGIVVGVGALAFALVRVPDDGWASGTVVGGLVLGVAGLAWVVWRSRRHPVPALDLSVLSLPVVGSAVLVMVAFMTAFGGLLVVSVLYLTGTLGWSEPAAGLGLAAGPAVVVVVSRLSGHLVARIGAGPVALLAAVVFGLGPAWWLVRLGVTPDYYWTGFLPGLLVTGLGVGLMLPTLSALVGSTLPARQWGSGSSLINTARQVGSVLGVALLVTAIGTATTGRPEELHLLRAGWVQLVIASSVAAVFAVFLTAAERREPGRTAPAGVVTPAEGPVGPG
jgi:MFS family permease